MSAIATRTDAPALSRALEERSWRKLAVAALAPWAVPAALIVLWELAAQIGWLSSRILPEPLAVLRSAWTLAASGELWTHVRVSAWRALSTFAMGGGLGLLLGLLTGTFRQAETLLDTSIQMIRNIPALALIPLVILWFGIDETAKLFLVSIGVFFPVYINTFHGIRAVDSGLIEMAKSYGLSGWALYRDIILPGALDALTRIDMQQLIENLWLEHGFTAVLVTHDVQEAVALADRVILIEDGRITLDERIAFARPRARGNLAFAQTEERILARVLKHAVHDPDRSLGDVSLLKTVNQVAWAI